MATPEVEVSHVDSTGSPVTTTSDHSFMAPRSYTEADM
jgi:hypothetical protein